jgi:mono/diheme cytochrome c family protein
MNTSRALPLVLLVASCSTSQYVRKTTDERVEATPARLARGRYLVDGPGACGACHTTWTNGNLFDGEGTEYLAGGNYLEAKATGYAAWVPNITPDPRTGIGAWSDDQVMRAIRDGIHADGHLLLPFLPFGSFQHMSDEDVRAVVAYLRSVPPREQTSPRKANKVPAMMGLFLKNGAAHHRPTVGVAAPPDGDKVRRGEYLAQVAQCPACHALGEKGEFPPTDPGYMAGSTFPLQRGIGKVWASNLTPSALGRFSADDIKKALVSGELLDGGRMASPMAERIPHLARMTAEDLDALVAWLQSLKPSDRKVPARELNEEGKRRFQR